MANFGSWLNQAIAVTSFSLRSIGNRKGSSASAALGIAGVVAVFVGVLSIAQGFRHTLEAEGSPDTVIVMRSGATSEMMSGLNREMTRVIADAPGVLQTDSGAASSAELFVVIDLKKRSTGTSANVPLRGVESAAFEIREHLEVIEGRTFEWGKNEVIVGVGAADSFAGLDLGSSIQVGQEKWHIVGVFEANGGISESEIWTDAGVLQPAYRRGDSFQSVYVKLSSPDRFEVFKDALTSDPRLNVKAVRQADYYAEQSTLIHDLITKVGTTIAFLMGLGAVFGALNTMYTAVSARTREIATLRALGFQAGPVVASILFESLVLAVVGGAVGGIAALLAFDGFRAATINWASFSQVAFAFDVTPALLIQGIVYAALIGLVGGLFPAIRAARLPIASALRGL